MSADAEGLAAATGRKVGLPEKCRWTAHLAPRSTFPLTPEFPTQNGLLHLGRGE
jgi:hypothetical protein